LQAAQDAGLEAVLVEVAEVKPLRLCVVESSVEPADFVDEVNFSPIDIVSLHAKRQTSHELLEREPLGKLVRAVKGQKMGKVPALHFLTAELIDNEISVHRDSDPA
jgi:hypothetical protein